MSNKLWTPKVLNVPFEPKPYKAYVVYGTDERKVKVGDFTEEDDAIKAAELEAMRRNR